MSYVLRYEKRVLKDLDRIPKEDIVRIDKTIQSLALQPYPSDIKKLVGEENFYLTSSCIRADLFLSLIFQPRENKPVSILIIHFSNQTFSLLFSSSEQSPNPPLKLRGGRGVTLCVSHMRPKYLFGLPAGRQAAV